MASVAGVAIASGEVYVAVVAPADRSLVLPVDRAKFSLADRLEPAQGLHDLMERIRQFLREHHVEGVALVETRLFANWKYADAYTRVMLIAAVMFACSEAQIEFETLKTERIAEVVGVSASALKDVSYADFGFDARPSNWKTGFAPAYCAAAAALAVV